MVALRAKRGTSPSRRTGLSVGTMMIPRSARNDKSGNDGCCFDFDHSAGLEQCSDDHDGHRRKMTPDDVTIRRTDRGPLAQVGLSIGDEPREPNELSRAGT